MWAEGKGPSWRDSIEVCDQKKGCPEAALIPFKARTTVDAT